MSIIDDSDYCDRCHGHHATLCPDDVEAVARVLMGGSDPCEGWISDATEVLLFARCAKGREIFGRAMELQWVEGSVDLNRTNPHIPRGRHNGVLWHARRLVGEWENIPYCHTCQHHHSGHCEESA